MQIGRVFWWTLSIAYSCWAFFWAGHAGSIADFIVLFLLLLSPLGLTALVLRSAKAVRVQALTIDRRRRMIDVVGLRRGLQITLSYPFSRVLEVKFKAAYRGLNTSRPAGIFIQLAAPDELITLDHLGDGEHAQLEAWISAMVQ